jgi:hypothetical protein
MCARVPFAERIRFPPPMPLKRASSVLAGRNPWQVLLDDDFTVTRVNPWDATVASTPVLSTGVRFRTTTLDPSPAEGVEPKA